MQDAASVIPMVLQHHPGNYGAGTRVAQVYNAVGQTLSHHANAHPPQPVMDMQQTTFLIEAREVMNGIQAVGV